MLTIATYFKAEAWMSVKNFLALACLSLVAFYLLGLLLLAVGVVTVSLFAARCLAQSMALPHITRTLE